MLHIEAILRKAFRSKNSTVSLKLKSDVVSGGGSREGLRLQTSEFHMRVSTRFKEDQKAFESKSAVRHQRERKHELGLQW